MPQQTGMVKPHTQHRGEQQLTWKKHLPAPGKPPQTSAGKHRGCESSRRFGCSPVPSFSSAHHLTVLLPPSSSLWAHRRLPQDQPGVRGVQGAESQAQTHPRDKPCCSGASPEGGVGIYVWSSTAGSGIPGSALLCVPAATWVWDCQQTLPATLTSNLCWVGVYMATFQPCRQQEPLPCVTSQTQRGWVVLGGWECDLPWPGLPHSVKFLNFSVFPLHKI